MTLSKDKISQSLLWVIRVGIFLILFLPLVMNSNFFFPFIVFKNVLFRISVEIIFVAYLILAHLDPSYRPQLNLKKINKISLALFTFFVISVIAWLFGIGLYRGFWGNYERMSGIFHFMHLILFFFVLVNVFKHKKDWHSFFSFSIFASLLMSFLAFAQYLEVPFLLQSSGGRRLTGTVGNATFFAAYLMFNLFFLLYFWAREKRFNLKLFFFSFLTFDIYLVVAAILSKIFAAGDWGSLNVLKAPFLNQALEYPKFFYPFILFQFLIFVVWFFRSKKNSIRVLLAVIFLFEFFIFFNTQTRGAVIGFTAGIAFLGLVSLFLKVDKRIKRVSLIFLVLVLISPVVLVLNKEAAWVKNVGTLNRLATISLTNITTETRLLTWNASWQGWKETPKSFLIGYGPENYYYAFNKYFPSQIYKDAGSRIWFDRAHNIIFDVGVTTGILGLIAYMSLLIFAALALFKNYQQTRSISSSWLLMALLIAYFIQNFFVFDTLNTEIPFYLFLAFIVFLTSSQPKQFSSAEASIEQAATESAPPKINYIYVSALLVVLLFGIFAINTKTLKANNYIFKALTVKEISLDEDKSSFGHFKKAINQAVSGRFEARQQLANYVNGVSGNKNIPEDHLRTMIDYATKELEKSVDEEPLNIRQYLFLSTFYNASTRFNRGNSQKVIILLQDAVDLSPTRPQIYYEIGQAYAFLNNFEKSSQYFEKGASIASRVIDDQWNLLTIYIVFQKNDLAEQQFDAMQQDLNWQPKLADYKRLVELYGRVSNYSKMIEFQNRVVELEPSVASYARLAALYAQVGENEKARQATQKSVEIDPNSSQEAEAFLELLEAGELLKIN